MYEDHLKSINPTIPQLTYTLADILRYVDNLPDLSMLVFERSGLYAPHDKAWIKARLQQHAIRMRS